MRITGLLALGVGVAAGYVLTSRLLHDEGFPDTLPEQVRPQARQARQRLLQLRAQASVAWREADIEREQAERDLLLEYERRSGRTVGSATPPRRLEG